MQSEVNRHFRIVFQPKDPSLFGGRRRFCVGGLSLAKYIGEDNAQTAIEKAFQNAADRYTKLFRTKGRIDFYNK